MRGNGFMQGNYSKGKKEGLLDTMILIHLDRPEDDSGTVNWLQEKIEEGWVFHISKITVMERFKYVANKEGNREKILNDIEFRLFELRKSKDINKVIPVTKPIAESAYSLLRQFCIIYTPPESNKKMEALICDMIIAATALRYNYTLFTKNLKHFEWIDGLNVEKPDY